MSVKPYLIAPFESGLQNNMEPWLLPDDAFENLEDAYIWRGRVRKRWGTSLLGSSPLNARLRIDIGTTDGGGGFAGAVPGAIFKVGQAFSVGSEIFTVNSAGSPAAMLASGSGSGTYDTATGAVVIAGATAATTLYFYPSDPVMGLRQRESPTVAFEGTIGFDTQFAYERTGGAWDRLGAALWTGSNSDFFWSINFRGANPYETYFYVVNFVAADNIKYLPEGTSTWTSLRPQLNGSGTNRFLETCRVLVGFKDRLVALNTVEDEGGTDRSYLSRARWSQLGDPTAPSTSWNDDVPGRGGFADAATKEAIVTAEFVKDRLIVYFERTTWELVWTGNASAPFYWAQINNELGCESTFSVIGFDKFAVGVGNVGVHSCTGVNVQRIDQKIPDQVFEIHNGNDGPARVYGIRDFFQEMIYWTFPDATGNPTYPTRVLTYNYQNETWALFNDSFTCFGYLQQDSDLTWAQLGEIYGTWANWNDPWGSPFSQSAFPFIVAGNQEGWTFFVEPDRSANARSLQITDMTPGTSTLTIIDHNLSEGAYIRVTNAVGVTDLNGVIVQVDSVTDANNVVVDTTFTGTYAGGGNTARISNLLIRSVQFNPGTPVGEQFKFSYIDFLLDRTSNGEVALDYFLDTTLASSVQFGSPPGVLLGSNVLLTRPEDNVPFQMIQNQIWHRYFLYANSGFVQLQLFLTDEQMRDYDVATSNFVLQGIVLYAEPAGRLIG